MWDDAKKHCEKSATITGYTMAAGSDLMTVTFPAGKMSAETRERIVAFLSRPHAYLVEIRTE
jgi:hypothetical protein